jgi:acetate kinase
LYVLGQVAEAMGKPVDQTSIIACHIGNGASMCAIKNGKCVDTTMGLTPLEGLVMGTRCGDIDPAIIPHLVQRLGYPLNEVSDMINKRAGLLGLCGTSDDRDIEERAIAKEPIGLLGKKIQVHRMRKYLGAYMVALDGKVDAVVFAGGMAEKSALLRTMLCENLEGIGFHVDEEKNHCDGGRFSENTPIHAEGSGSQIWVIPTDEELCIAQQAYDLCHT